MIKNKNMNNDKEEFVVESVSYRDKIKLNRKCLLFNDSSKPVENSFEFSTTINQLITTDKEIFEPQQQISANDNTLSISSYLSDTTLSVTSNSDDGKLIILLYYITFYLIYYIFFFY